MIYLVFILIALAFLNAAFLYWQHWQYRKHNRQMSCPLGGQCQEVVDSSYGEIFGISNDLAGLAFYLGFSLILLISLFYQPWSLWSGRLALIGIALAFLFTSYLLYIQAFVLKKWCFWCLVYALLNYLLFISFLIYYY